MKTMTLEWLRAWWRSRGRVSQQFLVQDGGLLPRFWGVAWVDYARRHAVVLPLPFNLVARAGWVLSCWARGHYLKTTRGERLLEVAREEGRQEERRKRWAGDTASASKRSKGQP